MIYIVLAWFLTVAASVALGGHILRAIRLQLDGWQALIYRFLLGSAALVLLTFCLASLGLIHKGLIFAIAITAIASSWRKWPTLPKPPFHWSAIPFGIYTIFYLTHALAPEHSPDGMSYHLGLVARYCREHGFVWFPTNMYAFLSQGTEMLFLFAYSMGRHSAAALIHFTFLLALPILLATTAGRIGWLAGLTVFLLPVVGIDGISAYNDVALTVTLFATWQASTKWRETQDKGWIAVAALLAGFAMAIKFTGVIAILFLPPTLRIWPAVISILPWLIKSYLWSGNPLAPFYNNLFPNPWFSVEFETGYRSFLRHYDVPNIQEWAREVFLGGPRLSGTLGPIGLLFPLAIFGLRKQKHLLLAAAIALAIYPLNIGTRFLIPALPFLSLALFQTFPRQTAAIPLAAAILSWPSVFALYSSPYAWFLEKAPWKAALRIETEDGFLVSKSGGYVTARTIDAFVPQGESVFALTPIPESYTSRNIIIAYQSTIGLKLQRALTAPTYDDYQAKFIYTCKGPNPTIAKSTKDTWSIAEIEPRPQSITCSRTPWDAHLANDGNLTTSWRTWAPAQKGDSCQLTPAQPYKLYGTGDQWEVELTDCTREVQPSQADYRSEARKLFLSQNIKYLAIDAPDFNSKDMIDHPDLWGIDLIAQRGTMRIYRWRESP
jgi:hypothetical protein